MREIGEVELPSPFTKPKVFKYSNVSIKIPEYHPSGASRVGVKESLTGTIQGKSASDIEERMSRAFDKLKIPYEFRARISSGAVGTQKLTKATKNIVGELEIDHLIDIGQIVPVLVDGEISHYMTPYQKLVDEEKTTAINEFGRSVGWSKVLRVPFTELENQEEADSVARRIYNGTYIPVFTA